MEQQHTRKMLKNMAMEKLKKVAKLKLENATL